MTRGDIIRRLDDQDLAVILVAASDGICYSERCDDHWLDCAECILDWLKEEEPGTGDGRQSGNNLSTYLLRLAATPRGLETIWMHFFSLGCAECPAKAHCDAQPEGTCCRENFMDWAGGCGT